MTYNISDELLGTVPVCLLRVSSDLVNYQKAPQASPTNRLAAQADGIRRPNVLCIVSGSKWITFTINMDHCEVLHSTGSSESLQLGYHIHVYFVMDWRMYSAV